MMIVIVILIVIVMSQHRRPNGRAVVGRCNTWFG